MMFILASASPRRKELLSKVIPDFLIIPSTIDEEKLTRRDIPAMEVPEFLSVQKAIDVHNNYPDSITIGSDTSIIFKDKIYGKPKNRSEAKEMLKNFSNQTHYVVTGVAIISKDKSISFSSVNEVTFYDLSDKEIEDYLDTNEYVDKAGSYAIQGKGTFLVKSITGDYNSIVGLPISEINHLLKKYF